MNDAENLLKAILAAPGEDTPRMIFADLLDEEGSPARAEAIRLQVELARLPAAARFPDSTVTSPVPIDHLPQWFRDREPFKSVLVRRREIQERLHELQKTEEFRSLLSWFAERGLVGVTERGFVSHLSCSCENWYKYEHELFWHPDRGGPCASTAQPLERLILTDRPECHRTLQDYPGRGWYASLVQGAINVFRPVENIVVRDFYEDYVLKELFRVNWPDIQVGMPPRHHLYLSGAALSGVIPPSSFYFPSVAVNDRDFLPRMVILGTHV